ncbi:dual specificity protein kinase splA-like [Rhopalosiphum padi]|uniref:dual specificity protein kinase splA-like n=1 Tax=Rhopalosiphum padi TaxID=40932 RepID=UPI00298DDC94|nr:dual specificity protein kinase splA-like [Rhopalosiphum padi]
MQFFYYCLVFLSTVSVAVLFEVKKIYVIERDFKTGVLRARRQNVPVQSHTVARIGGLQEHHHHQQSMFTVAVSPPPLQSVQTGGQMQQPADLASTVDLTADSRAPIDYLTPPPNADYQLLQSFQPPAGGESTPLNRPESHVQNVQAPQPPPLVPLTAPSAPVPVHTSPFTPSVGIGGGGGGGGGFHSAQAQPPPPLTPLGSIAVQTSSPSNQVHSLTFANPPLEQFTPYTPTLQANDPAANHQQQQQNGGRWELGFDANDILTPPFAGVPEQPSGASSQTFFQQDFGQEAAGSVRNNKQYPPNPSGGSLFFGGGGFDGSAATNTKFTPLDAVIRPSASNKNVYWGTPKTAQQQPLRPPPSFAEPNAFRFNSNNNNHLHQLQHHNSHNHHHQYVDPFQMPFTGQFDGPLSQGTVADHVVHSSFRIKRQLRDAAPEPADSSDAIDHSDGDRFGDRKPVYSFVKTDKSGNFKWSVRHGY